ncbi:hypothetical protein B0H13DRAFT_2281450, partial [Mycena leptocephala]
MGKPSQHDFEILTECSESEAQVQGTRYSRFIASLGLSTFMCARRAVFLAATDVAAGAILLAASGFPGGYSSGLPFSPLV